MDRFCMLGVRSQEENGKVDWSCGRKRLLCVTRGAGHTSGVGCVLGGEKAASTLLEAGRSGLLVSRLLVPPRCLGWMAAPQGVEGRASCRCALGPSHGDSRARDQDSVDYQGASCQGGEGSRCSFLPPKWCEGEGGVVR